MLKTGRTKGGAGRHQKKMKMNNWTKENLNLTYVPFSELSQTGKIDLKGPSNIVNARKFFNIKKMSTLTKTKSQLKRLTENSVTPRTNPKIKRRHSSKYRSKRKQRTKLDQDLSARNSRGLLYKSRDKPKKSHNFLNISGPVQITNHLYGLQV